MDAFLQASELIDWTQPAVLARARALRGGSRDAQAVAQVCFEWVRDRIRHSIDASERTVTCSASEVLAAGTGLCYAKSHLLAALLRASGVPSGFCYQRLRLAADGQRFCLHGFNAVFLPRFGWYRIDPRGNRAGIDTRFEPPVERLAFQVQEVGEIDFEQIWPAPLPVVVAALRAHPGADVLRLELPDFAGEPTADGSDVERAAKP